MFRLFLFVSGGIMVILMLFIAGLIGKEGQAQRMVLSPLERGLATTRKIYTVFSVQVLMILMLLLIFDLEVVFVIRFVLRGSFSLLKRLCFIAFITGTLWLE